MKLSYSSWMTQSIMTATRHDMAPNSRPIRAGLPINTSPALSDRRTYGAVYPQPQPGKPQGSAGADRIAHRGRIGQCAPGDPAPCANELASAPWTGIDCRSSRGSARRRSSNRRSARSWLKPLRTTMRSTARSVRLSGKV